MGWIVHLQGVYSPFILRLLAIGSQREKDAQGSCIGLVRSAPSVVILIIDKNGIFIFEGERKPPISIDADCPMAGKFTAQCMELPSRKSHLFWLCRSVQRRELVIELRGMSRLNPSF
jgi:hypothetical protein